MLSINYESDDDYQVAPPSKKMKYSHVSSDEEHNDQQEEEEEKETKLEIVYDYVPLLCPELPDFIKSTTLTTTTSSESNKGYWPTYVHLPIHLSSTNNDGIHSNKNQHHLQNLMTMIDEKSLHVSVTTTKLFTYPVCLEIARKLYEFAQTMKRKHMSRLMFTSNSVGIIENLNLEDKHVDHHPLIYLVHHLDQTSSFAQIVKDLQYCIKKRQTIDNSMEGYFDIDDNWKVHITTGRYDTMGNVKQETIDQWLKEDPVKLDKPVEWEWDGTIVMFCGNRKYIWNCFEYTA
jgi:hypothetical protein